jgi:DNA invertase Pin-like site-specific DNA recombinase
MARTGYARVCTIDQDLDIQNRRLKAACCAIIRSGTALGASQKVDPSWKPLQFLRAGDMVVLRLDRPCRSIRNVPNLVS